MKKNILRNLDTLRNGFLPCHNQVHFFNYSLGAFIFLPIPLQRTTTRSPNNQFFRSDVILVSDTSFQSSNTKEL